MNEEDVRRILKENQSLTTAFTINSNTDYPGPPSPVSLQFDGLQFKPEDQTYDIQVSLTSPELVGYVKIAIWDAKGGSKADEYVFENPTGFNTFTIPTSKLTSGRDYEMRISAVSRARNLPSIALRFRGVDCKKVPLGNDCDEMHVGSGKTGVYGWCAATPRHYPDVLVVISTAGVDPLRPPVLV